MTGVVTAGTAVAPAVMVETVAVEMAAAVAGEMVVEVVVAAEATEASADS
ncbi:MAG TPA: hypothetical protein VFN97_18055 [Actinospica sp.]|nr:hypothetical protein [Actinospica sp.]